MLINPMKLADLPEVLALEQRSFARPWSRDSFLTALASPQQQFFVAKIEEQLVGYLGLWRMYDLVHITNLAVAQHCRRQGIATQLLAKAEKWAAASPLTLEVRLHNAPARALYEKIGFQVYGVRPGYYEDNGEDALILGKESGRDTGD